MSEGTGDLRVPDDYYLQIRNLKRNIFVTQLGDRRDEDDEDVNHIPIVRQASGEILASDPKTFQKTLVLKKEVEVDQVSAALAAKRQEFSERMEAVAKRMVEYEKAELASKQRALKFDKFLKDNEAKRRRAIQKYQLEVKQNEAKSQELQNLLRQLEELKVRQRKLQKKMTQNKIYEEYLQNAIDNMPEDYLEYNAESLLLSIIRRYETLGATNETLINNLSRLSDVQEKSQHHLEALRQEHGNSKLTINSELSLLRDKCDKRKEKNRQLEMKINLHGGNFRYKSEELGALLLAINNLADQCYVKHYGALKEISILGKLDMIKEFILEKRVVTQMAMQAVDSMLAADQNHSKSGVSNQLRASKLSMGNHNKTLSSDQRNRLKLSNSKTQ
ncbi:coiled-coil domain-containing protein 42 homolog isoform X1 [Callorhinchus milii]|uniref:coiled-coil domain-containing protein 42 homolog isoform X1 n=1 Tax=Callorhinchus milii TaxID=7868 RepID=UPI00045754E5|nr:coiled-coil domain-containing protein 42 homolog isoform X1 [Callorhinchus milii]XP_007902059.1 coiled-coil domain-containing protein 42 homolog isoform X1 [Callorhinchus milii]|eukprot:gi/632971208/ref/XP_007902058.1/ PREDICTED: coiled-coil domain-containing protein 42 homolog isoform X1 [Callorhinchus milii]